MRKLVLFVLLLLSAVCAGAFAAEANQPGAYSFSDDETTGMRTWTYNENGTALFSWFEPIFGNSLSAGRRRAVSSLAFYHDCNQNGLADSPEPRTISPTFKVVMLVSPPDPSQPHILTGPATQSLPPRMITFYYDPSNGWFAEKKDLVLNAQGNPVVDWTIFGRENACHDVVQ